MSREDFPMQAAIRMRDGRVFEGDFHAEAVRDAYEHYDQAGDERSLDALLAQQYEAGFVTSGGRFVNRREAHEIAVAAGLNPRSATHLDSTDLQDIREWTRILEAEEAVRRMRDKAAPGAHMVYR
jgi:hypothetical protein